MTLHLEAPFDRVPADLTRLESRVASRRAEVAADPSRRTALNNHELLSFDPSYCRANSETVVRHFSHDDLDAILSIESDSFEFPWSSKDLEFCLSLDRCDCLVAERDGDVVGYLIYERRNRTVLLLSCAVLDTERRSGVGSALLRELAEEIRSSRSEIVSVVRERNVVAQVFLRSVGFRAQWIKRQYYSSADEDAYRMTWRLDAAERYDYVPARRAG